MRGCLWECVRVLRRILSDKTWHNTNILIVIICSADDILVSKKEKSVPDSLFCHLLKSRMLSAAVLLTSVLLCLNDCLFSGLLHCMESSSKVIEVFVGRV